MTTIAIVDDDDGLRRALVALLTVGSRRVLAYGSGEDFLVAVPNESIDLALLDLRLPGIMGIEILERLQPLPFPIVMISASGNVRAAVEAIRLGALDFIEKPFTPDQIETLVEKVLQDRGADASLFAPSQRLERICLADLTPREKQVALALSDGLTNKEIAQRLGCSPRTIEVHRSRVFSKLGVSNIASLVRTVDGVRT